ncbi:hypothetical protein RCO48_05955 [Peribacillus frigoritolerans]|nr:hypothetical protein [Peribacillus frigoritolerans]
MDQIARQSSLTKEQTISVIEQQRLRGEWKMNKARLQGLSAGIIFTTTIFAAFYYGTGKFEGTTPTAEEAKELLVKKGFVVTLPTEEAKRDRPTKGSG